MHWADELADQLHPAQAQTINDSKTPSGRVHVGSLRGVLIHDAVFRLLQERGITAKYIYGVDDYDPLDELPAGRGDYFRQYLGVPLCNVPAPEGSPASDMAEHYISEFFEVFQTLHVNPTIYRMRDIYRSGQFNTAIDVILSNVEKVRRVYKDVSNAERPSNWYPFQVICEKCGCIGTTEVTHYDGKEVTYTCRPDLVTWATGCGHQGKISPFDGNGKLPWKLEWAAKWHSFPVTIEGAGKDHSTRGGSRDVAAACLRAIFDQEPPVDIPYEFFLVKGSKMSSSRGIGASAREVSELLPPEVLRFLMLGVQPRKIVNFSTEREKIIQLFNNFDRLQERFWEDQPGDEERRIFALSVIHPEERHFLLSFQSLITLVQLPHIDIIDAASRQKGSALTAVEIRKLEQRAHSARYWVDHYASDDDKIVLQDSLPASAETLTAVQRAFLHLFASQVPGVAWNEDALQAAIFDTARIVPINPALAFKAIYTVLLDRNSGPKAGNLLSVLEPAMIVSRFTATPYSAEDFRQQTAESPQAFLEWLGKHSPHITGVELPVAGSDLRYLEFLIHLDDQKTHMKRVDNAVEGEETAGDRQTALEQFIETIRNQFNLSITPAKA